MSNAEYCIISDYRTSLYVCLDHKEQLMDRIKDFNLSINKLSKNTIGAFKCYFCLHNF